MSVWICTTLWLLSFPNQQKSLKPFLSHCEQEDQVSVKFGFSMLWIQMSTASRGSGWCHVWHYRSERGLGWLTKIGVVELFTFHLYLRLFWGFVWLTLAFFSALLHKPLLPHFLSVMHCMSLKILLVLGDLWKIYNRWAVSERYVFSNYLFTVGFGCVVAQPNVLSTQPCFLPLFVACESKWVKITNHLNNALQTWSRHWLYTKQRHKLSVLYQTFNIW